MSLIEKSDDEEKYYDATNQGPSSYVGSTGNVQLSSALKLHNFWTKRPDLWFLQVKSQLKLGR